MYDGPEPEEGNRTLGTVPLVSGSGTGETSKVGSP